MGNRKYSHEMDTWLQENVPGQPRKRTYDDFRKRFGDWFTDESIDGRITKLKIQTGLQVKWTPEEDATIIEMKAAGKLWKEMVPILEEISGNRRSIHSLKGRAKHLGIRDEKKGLPWTEAEEQWLRDNSDSFKNYQELTKEFNRTFGTERHWRAIQTHSVRYCNVISGRQRFKKGTKPWCTHEVGTESTLFSGYTYVKLEDGRWIPKQQLVYENAFGKIADDQFVVFLNRDKEDYSVDNLYPVNRAVHARMCSNGWYSEDPERTLAAIKLCELNGLIKSINDNGR